MDLTVLRAATEHDLRPALVAAVVSVESGGVPWAWNPEPRWRYFWDVRRGQPFRPVSTLEIANQFPPQDFPALVGDRDQEWWAQQASWGLMQVMGAVARELGCKAPYLTSLCNPDVGLHWGCLKLHTELQWAAGDVAAALAAYNGGRAGNAPGGPLRNQAYADKVLSRVDDHA